MRNRHATIANYAEAVVEGMDFKTLWRFAVDTIIEDLDDYSDQQIIELCNEYQDNGLIE